MKKILVILLIGTALGIATQLFTRSTQTTYYPDFCASVGGCCPGQGYIKGSTKYCPDPRQDFGFPIHTKDRANANRSAIFLINTAVVALAFSVVAAPSLALVEKRRQKRKNSII